jgi:hypothetical protein
MAKLQEIFASIFRFIKFGKLCKKKHAFFFKLKEHYRYSLSILTVISFFISLSLLISMQYWSYACLYSLFFIIITFGCPLILIILQPYKRFV